MKIRKFNLFKLAALCSLLNFFGCGDSLEYIDLDSVLAEEREAAILDSLANREQFVQDSLALRRMNYRDSMEKVMFAKMASFVIDNRDGRTYKTVMIGSDTMWTAENLKYVSEGSACFDAVSCELYGRYYTVEAAKNACPATWRLPSRAEYEKLLGRVGTTPAERSLYLVNRVDELGRVTDKYGFSAIFAGYCSEFLLAVEPEYCGSSAFGSSAYFLTSDSYALVITLDDVRFERVSTINSSTYIATKNFYSVRCVK